MIEISSYMFHLVISRETDLFTQEAELSSLGKPKVKTEQSSLLLSASLPSGAEEERKTIYRFYLINVMFYSHRNNDNEC